MRLISALAAVVALALLLPCASPAAGPPGPVSLAHGWEVAPDPGDVGLSRSWQSGRHGGGWTPATIPHVVDPTTEERTFRGSVAWYRLTFDGPAIAAGLHWALRFEQARRSARVWLNGRPLGGNDSPYTPFELRADGLRPGRPNTLVVRVDYRRAAGLREGWWNWGGITRPLSLVARGPIVLEDASLLPRRRCAASRCRWSVLVDGWLENEGWSRQRASVAVRLHGPRGVDSVGAASPRALHPGERVRVRFAVALRGEARLWSPAQPTLYPATITTSVDGRPVQVERRRVGLRTVTVDDGVLRLNGRPLNLRGASIQEDVPGRGAALTDADIARTVADLRKLGANVTRAHYLLDERLLERFDEEGILVWSQAPVYHRDLRLRTPEQRARELRVLRGTILAARSHPSVITHSVANELTPTPDRTRPTGVWLRDAAALARTLDPTLPISVDILSYPGIPRQRTYDAFDMLGINSYYGWYEGKRNRSTADIDDLAPYLRAMHGKYPGKALVVTEFGAEATNDGPSSVKQTYGFQKRYVERNLEIIGSLPFMGGAIYWTTREFAVKPRWDGGAHPAIRDSIHNKGLIAYDGTAKPAFEAARAAFQTTPLYRDDPAATARAELAQPGPLLLRALLLLIVIGVVAGLLVVDALCLRDIWRARRRPHEAQVVELSSRRVA